MKTRLLLLLAAATLLAQQTTEFSASMKAAAAAMAVIAKSENKANSETVRAAERLGAVYEEMIGFWRQRDAASAVKLSQEGKAAAVALASAARAGDSDRAAEAHKLLGATCKPCHEKYRQKLPDGTYRIQLPAGEN